MPNFLNRCAKGLLTIMLLLGVGFAAPAIAANGLPHEQQASAMQGIAVVTANTAFIDAWHSLPAGEAPRIQTISTAKVGQPLTFAMLAYLPANLAGAHTLNFGVKLVAPDGTVAIHQPNYAKAQAVIGDGGGYVLADPALSFAFTAQDAPGVYQFYVQITNETQATQAYAEYRITLK